MSVPPTLLDFFRTKQPLTGSRKATKEEGPKSKPQRQGRLAEQPQASGTLWLVDLLVGENAVPLSPKISRTAMWGRLLFISCIPKTLQHLAGGGRRRMCYIETDQAQTHINLLAHLFHEAHTFA